MMTFAELKNKSGQVYPAVLLDSYFSQKTRKIIRICLFWAIIISFVLIFFTDNTNIRGLFFVALSVWAMFMTLESFYLSYYFSNSSIDFEVAKLIYSSDENDLTKGFLESEMGYFTMLRLGLGRKEIADFLKSSRKNINTGMVDIFENKKDDSVGISEYCKVIYSNDQYFSNFLRKYNITEEIFIGAILWIDHAEWQSRDATRFWSRENLYRIKSLGRGWNFISKLDFFDFGQFIFRTNSYIEIGDRWRAYQDNIEKIESVLLKDPDSNIMLISPTHDIGMENISAFAKFISNGNVYSEIENKKIFILDNKKIFLERVEKTEPAQTEPAQTEIDRISNIFQKIFDESEKIGEIILVLPNIDETIELGIKIGINIPDLLKNILNSSRIHLIAISGADNYRESIETNISFVNNFEKITIKDITKKTGITILEKEAIVLESKYDLFFTYQSLVAIADIVDKFSFKERYLEKIVYLINQTAIYCSKQKKYLVKEHDIQTIFATKNNEI